jgi:ankyrin repeat protein
MTDTMQIPQSPEYLGVAFDKLLQTSMTSDAATFESEIETWIADTINASNLAGATAVLPTVLPNDISTRLLLHVACHSYKHSATKIYMLVNKHGADVNAMKATPDRFGRSMLSAAIAGRRDDAAMALLDLGAHANLEIGLRGQHPLIDVAFKGSPGVLRSMFEHGADMKVTNAWGNTVLVAAVTSGNIGNVRFLIETAGLDVNTFGGTGLRVMELHDTDVPLEHDASYNIRRDQLWSPLHAATDLKHADGVEMVKLLLANGANVNHRCELPHTGGGYTPLELLTIHARLPGATNDRHDTVAMAECQAILEAAMRATFLHAVDSTAHHRGELPHTKDTVAMAECQAILEAAMTAK